MKKVSIMILVSLLLVGCGSKRSTQDILNEALSISPVVGTNHSKGMLKYYLNPNMGLKASTQTSSLIMIDNTEVMLSIKVSNIMGTYYKDKNAKEMMIQMSKENLSEGEIIEGMYLDQLNQQHKYIYNEVEIGNQIGVTLDNGFVSLVTLIYPAQRSTVVPGMVSILRSTQIEEELVVAAFSNKEIIEYDTIHREFFEQEIPESGSLIDMYNKMHPEDKIE